MKPNSRQIRELRLRLTPTQAVRLWMTEAHEHPCLTDYVSWAVAKGKSALPMVAVPKQVEEATHAALRGSRMRWEEVEQAARAAVRDALYLLHLHHDLNVRIERKEEEWRLHLLLISEQLRHLLTRQLATSHLANLRLKLSEQPYPLAESIAAAVRAAQGHAVETWAILEDAQTIQDWVVRQLIAEGHAELPDGASTFQLDPDGTRWPLFRHADPEELRPLFADEAAWAAFCGGEDYTSGLADVPDAVVAERVAAVEQALRALVDGCAVQAGSQIELPSVPIVFLRYAPLVDGCWLDREVLALAEWGAELERLGYQRQEQEDDHPFAVDRFTPPDGKADQVTELLEAARSKLATFPGRAHDIDGRPFVHLDDYRRWRTRRLRDLPQAEPGMVIASWNAWVEANGGDGVSSVAHVPVNRLTTWSEGYAVEAFPDGDAAARQATRHALVGSIFNERTATRDRDREREDALRLREHLDLHVRDLYATRDAIAAISQRYLSGAELLFPAERGLLDEHISRAEELVQDFNRFIARDIDVHVQDAGPEAVAPSSSAFQFDALLAASGAIRDTIVRFEVDHARAKTLDDLGRTDEGQAILAGYLGHAG